MAEIKKKRAFAMQKPRRTSRDGDDRRTDRQRAADRRRHEERARTGFKRT